MAAVNQPGYRDAAGVAIGPGGDTMVAGVDWREGTVAVARYRPDGTPDPGYGEGGIASLDAAVRAEAVSGIYSVGGITGFAVDGMGRALVLSRGAYLTRLTADGGLDESFGTGGTVTLTAGDSPPRFVSIAAAADGSIVLAGFGYGISHVFVARLLADGSRDTSFGRGGVASVGIGDRERNSVARRVAIGRDGSITVAGFASRRPAVVRLRPDGSPDLRFGERGRVLAPRWLSGEASALVVTPRGGAVVGCLCSLFGTTRQARALLRFGPRGGFDRAFSTASIRAQGNSAFRPTALHLSGQRIVAVGGSEKGKAVQVFDVNGMRGPSLAGVQGVPAGHLFGLFSSAGAGSLTLAWTAPEERGRQGGIRLARFHIR